MSQQIQIKGYLLVGGGCGDGCAGSVPSGCPWDLSLGNCTSGETYSQVRQINDFQIATNPTEFVDLPIGSFSQIELLLLESTGPLTLRVNGAPAKALTNANWPVAGLNTLTLIFDVDSVTVSVTFVTGDDTPAEVAARINAAAMLAGLAYLPASVTTTGQVQISGKKTGAQGSLSAFTGSAVATLGLGSAVAQLGKGSDIPVSGLLLQQFGRNPNGATRLEVSGATTLSALAAGV